MFRGFVAAVALLLASCAKQEPVAPQPAGPEEGKPYFVSYEQALVGLNELMGSLADRPVTLGGQPMRAVANHYTYSFGDPATLAEGDSTEISTDIYVVNFDDEQGFAILASDERLPGVFALAESGSLDLSQPIENPGVDIFVENLGIMLMASGGNGPFDPIDDPNGQDVVYQYGPWENAEHVGDVIDAKWGQGGNWDNPYSKFCPLRGGQYPPAGCTAVAVAQIMYHWGAPNSYNGYSFVWSEMRKHLYYYPYNDDLTDQYSYAPAHDMIARLMEQLGTGPNLAISYGAQTSGAYSKNAPRTFQSFGYSCGSLQAYDATAILNSLSLNRPVYARGEIPNGKGHAWVIDAAIKRRRLVTIIDFRKDLIMTSYEYDNNNPLVHCNWGWDGSDDGYYYSGAFNLVNNPESEAPEDFEDNNESFDLRYELRIIPNIYR